MIRSGENYVMKLTRDLPFGSLPKSPPNIIFRGIKLKLSIDGSVL
jgi:hypothetical protein